MKKSTFARTALPFERDLDSDNTDSAPYAFVGALSYALTRNVSRLGGKPGKCSGRCNLAVPILKFSVPEIEKNSKNSLEQFPMAVHFSFLSVYSSRNIYN